MLYQPSYPQPYLTDIDATESNVFQCFINAEGGTQVLQYNVNILDLNGIQIYTSGIQTLTNPLYSNEVIDMTIPSTSGMINGNDYVWNVVLYEQNPDIWVAYGTIQPAPVSTTTNIYIRSSYLIKAGMYIRIGNEIREISTYDSTSGLAVVTTAFSTAPTSGTAYNVYSNSVTSNDIFLSCKI